MQIDHRTLEAQQIDSQPGRNLESAARRGNETCRII